MSAGGSCDDYGYGITSHADGSSVVTGYFVGTASFTPVVSGHSITDISSVSGSSDIFVAKVSSDGKWIWAVRAGGGSDDRGYGITSHADGSSVVTGDFSGTASFSPVASGHSISALSSVSSNVDIFVAKVSSDG